MRIVYFLAIAANSLDLVATTLGIHWFGNREGNPLLAGVAHGHWWAFVLLKGVLTADDADLSKAELDGLIKVFLDHDVDLLRLKRMQVDEILDWDVMHQAGQSKAIDLFLNFPVMDMPDWCQGRASTLEEAQVEAKEAFTRIRGSLSQAEYDEALWKKDGKVRGLN